MTTFLVLLSVNLLFAFTSAETKSCPVCKDGTALVYPNAMVQIPEEYHASTNGITELTCAQIDTIATSGFLESSICDVLESDWFGALCACSKDAKDVLVTQMDAPCYLCEDGYTVGLPDKSIELPFDFLIKTATCQQIEQLGMIGLIGASYCASISQLVPICTCIPKSEAPIASVPEDNMCLVCGSGNVVGNPDYVISAPPGLPVETIACYQAEQAGALGLIPMQYCPLVINSIKNSDCGCKPAGEVESEATSAPTYAPTAAVSDAPSDVPSDVPSDIISDAPSDAPSDIVSDSPSTVPTQAPIVWKQQSWTAPTKPTSWEEKSWTPPAKPTSWKAQSWTAPAAKPTWKK